MSEDRSRKRDQYEDYQQTARALLAFAAFVGHDGVGARHEAAFGIGRRMQTSKDNKVAPSSTISPDLVAQKSPAYGLVAEAKKSLPKDTGRWNKYLEQLRKYDDFLSGWWTPDETVLEYNAALLIHQSRSRAFIQYLASRLRRC